MFTRIALVAIGSMLLLLVLGFGGAALPSGINAAGSDTIVNIETHPNGFGDQFVVVRPVDWKQPVYGIWVTGACAATLTVGDAWPAC